MSETRTATPETTSTTKVRVHRRSAGETAPRYDTFEVALGPRATVLDALVAIRRTQDPTLTFRHSCFHASCGTCAMRVDGQEGLACVTAIDGRTEVRVDPLANLPVVSDLVVAMEPFYGDFERSGRDLVRDSEALPEGHAPEGVETLTRYEDCIECGICVSACPIAGSDSRYVGPAALAAAWRAAVAKSGSEREAAIRFADDEHGIWRCHVAFECTEACPSNVDPAGSIMRLRRAAVGARFRRAFGGGRDQA
jgi:succinate dehydrogenase / fumarate reductase, iron-sulfur subunit